MRAMVVLLMVGIGGCGSKVTDKVELDIVVDAPAAASALVDGKQPLPATGGSYARGYPTIDDARKAAGTVATLAADGSTRASADYSFGSYCDAVTPLLRQSETFAESDDGMGTITLALASVECERTDGTGTIITP